MESKESNGVSVKEEMEAIPKDIEEKSLRCTSNFEDHSFDNVEDQSEGDEIKEGEEEVDVLEWSGLNDNNRVDVSECDDGNGTDEYSSSFSGTVSEHESDKSGFNDQEADSMMCTDTSLPFYVRKKKVTDHWRKCIHPIMWRCKWLELKIKEFQSQAQMYDKEVKESCQAKQMELENLKSEEVGIKATSPLPCHTQKTQLKKRHKRKRVEEADDVPSNALNHNLFSYHAYRKSFADTALNDNSRKLDKKNKSSKEDAVFSEDTPPLEFREGDAFLEQILLKIEAAKLEVHNLKNRVDKVMNENPSRFSLDDTVIMLGSADVATGSEQQNPELVIKNEDENPVISEEEPAKSASVSSHHDKLAEEDDGGTDILLSEMIPSRRRERKAIVPGQEKNTTQS
ncbi:hypothetical protein N665_0008s0080 [Sinapis alba]|nr:hypothetical protein N665_0008s0080 [Sinapis alba]